LILTKVSRICRLNIISRMVALCISAVVPKFFSVVKNLLSNRAKTENQNCLQSVIGS